MNKVISQCVFLTATCVFITLFGLSLKGQLLEDFSDGNFSDNPEWTGDIALFRIDNSQLRLNSASGFDSSFLVTPNHSEYSDECVPVIPGESVPPFSRWIQGLKLTIFL